LILLGISITLFLGVSWLAIEMHARPSATTSVISQIGNAAFGGGPGYYLLQGFTFAILIFAANTSFQGFPRLGALLARDRYFPRQFVNLGDRLVYSNGILFLASLSIALLVVFRGNVISLLHLYVVGVFTAFTLSQFGMVHYWLRRRERRSAIINGIGGLATGIVTLIVIETKFTEGAWAVIVAIPLFVLTFYGINRHYQKVRRRLLAGASAVKRVHEPTNEIVLPVGELDQATRLAVWYVSQVAGKSYHPVWKPSEEARDPRGLWYDFSGAGPQLEQLDTSVGFVDAVREYVWQLPRGEANFVTVVVPEQFRRPSLLEAVQRRRESFLLKLRLLSEPGIAITDITMVERQDGQLPQRIVCRIIASGAHGAALRAVNYVRTLGISDSQAVFFAFDEQDATRMRREWRDAEVDFPLEIDEARYRDIGDPLLNYVRKLTADPGVVVQVVMPEVIVPGMRKLLHNQRALYVKRLMLFEPQVILTSVPYQLP
jgi:hypothetical protein